MTGSEARWAERRGRSTSVLALLVGGAMCLIASTQVWATTEVAEAAVMSEGSAALPLLQPLSLAAMALALALALTGRIVRLILAGLAVIIGVSLVAVIVPVAVRAPVSAVQSAVTDHTGIAGDEAVADLVTGIEVTPWPWISLVFAALIAAAGVLTFATSSRWRRGGRRYEHAGARAQAAAGGGPLDAVDSWDDLSRGDDPTLAAERQSAEPERIEPPHGEGRRD
ncbi:Trp biosynthesis-associated membrane protein [Microbacterium sp. G2-8]|uniref:Trp biosynthesis-associated membrane protein n=1 Tax=Microbacterium sp. G2-8 TaxID=2842454 RepID=UPI001C8A49B1|nr:Trp biosynthesis-associated membrane protein [Microbacterium sp. G2-8]